MPGKPFVSVIMPVFNAADIFGGVLDSIPDNLGEDFELIMIDDCSTDGTGDLIRRHPKAGRIKLLKTPVNSGPATARNMGVDAANADALLFFDADVVFLPDTFERVREYLTKNPSARCFTGINSPDSASPGLISRFHALYSYYALNLIPEGGAASTWNPRLGFVTKELYRAVGGFDTTYRKADVEDYDFSKNLAKVTPIVFTRTLEIKHHFGGFAASSKNFFKRSRQWTHLLFRRKSLDKTGHTRVSNVPNVLIPSLMTACLVLSPFVPVGRFLPVLLAAHFLFNITETLFFIRAAGPAQGLLFSLMILWFYWLASLGIVLGLLDVAWSMVRGKRP
ncbi:MAG: glycosyltransferase family 2 protein [Elusimicrobia bacterium]|nr:glycosyltransferase family 2 protein [Elusimicrobiota bacterium]